jgi:histidine triad (HIT) family protein
MASIFSKIVSGQIPCYKVAETTNCLAFLDIYPIARAHTLVIPKKEVDNIFDLEEPLYSELFLLAKKIAGGIEKIEKCAKVGIAVVGLEVPHAHIHLVPINGVYDIDFRKPKLKFTPEEFSAIASEIAAAMD